MSSYDDSIQVIVSTSSPFILTQWKTKSTCDKQLRAGNITQQSIQVATHYIDQLRQKAKLYVPVSGTSCTPQDGYTDN